jgi:hypothetical protein
MSHCAFRITARVYWRFERQQEMIIALLIFYSTQMADFTCFAIKRELSRSFVDYFLISGKLIIVSN